jgi:hypothetical protein
MEYIQNNPENKLPAPTARLYRIKLNTLYSALKRTSNIRAINRRQNRILQPFYEEALHTFIRSLLTNGLLPIPELIYSIICNLRRQTNPYTSNPSNQ